MARLTSLPGPVLTAKEGNGTGKKLVLVALLFAGLAIALRRRRSSSAIEAADESRSGIDQIRTDDGDDAASAADDEGAAAADDAIDEADDDVVEVTTEADDDDRVVAPLRLDTDASLDLFDLVSIVGAAYKAAKNEYEDRRAVEA